MRNKINSRSVLYSLICAGMLITACSGGGKEPEAVPEPEKAVLTSPQNNLICLTGNVISDAQSSVTFTWSASRYTDSYQVHVKNLKNNSTLMKPVSAGTSVEVTLLRNTPYSWYVISKSDKSPASAQSDTWKFYNSGAAETHPPFPAELVAPGFGATYLTGTLAELRWKGSDTDGDIAGYEVYFGTDTAPPLYKSNVTDMFLKDVPIAPAKTYYWKVTTKDMEGNTTTSELFQFNVR